MANIRSVVHSLFTKHLFITNMVSFGGLLALGDSITQTLEYMHDKGLKGKKNIIDYGRTGRMFTVGSVLGAFTHHWYRLLDKYVVGSGMRVVAQKIFADQLLAGPIFYTIFLVGSDLLEGKCLDGCADEWRHKFIAIYMVDWCVWPPAQFINFYFLPTHFRVFYVSLVTLCWNVFMSYVKHKEMPHTVSVGPAALDENK